MKKILLFILIVISIQSLGQTPPGYQTRIVRERIQGSFMTDSTEHIPRYCGTPSGVRGGGSIQDGAVAMDTCNSILYFYSEGVWKRAGTEDIKCGLTCASCGIVTWTGFGLNFNASKAWYNLDGASYYFAGDSISLDAADGSFGRFDAITLSSTGLAKITGTASADPQLPQYDPCTNVLLTYVFVGAGVTTPAATISDEVIYDENNETWTHATGGTISANFSSNVSSSHGDTSIRVASWSTNATITFTAPGTLLVNNYTTLSFWVKLSAIMVNNQNISIQFFNGTTAISNQVQAQITKGNITTWQSASFNMPQFTFTGSTFTAIKFNFSGSQSNVTFIDWVRLQAGVTQPQPPSGISSAYGRMTDGSNLATATGSDIFMLRSALPLRNVVTNNDALYGDNNLLSVDTSRAFTPSLATNAIVKKQVDSLGGIIGTKTTLAAVKALTKSKGVTIESPTSAENFGLWQTQVDITVSSINAVVIGSSPSVTINIAFGSNITSLTNVFSSGTAITNTTTGQTINSGFNDATIPAGSWIRLTSSAQSGTVTQIEVTINYTED